MMKNTEMEKLSTEEYRVAEWEKMFREAEEMKDEMKFYSLEMGFLHRLLDRYLLWLIEEESLSGLQILNSKIKSADQKCTDFIAKAESLMTRLGHLIENPFAQDEHLVQESFKRTNEENTSFKAELKRLKNEVFDHVAHTLRTEKAKKLLGSHKEDTGK